MSASTLLSAASLCAADTPVAGVAKTGTPRVEGADWKLAEVPKFLEGQPAYRIPRGEPTEPGAAFQIVVDKPSTIYLAVMRRSNPELPKEWEPTAMRLKWGEGFEDMVFQRTVEPGVVEIPPHHGQSRGQFGIPHLAIVRDGHWPVLQLEMYGDRQGFLFTESETPELKFKVRGGRGEPKITYEVREVEGDFTLRGEMPSPRDTESALILGLPHRGLYEVVVTAETDGLTIARSTTAGVVFEPNPTAAKSSWGIFWIGTGRGNTPDQVAESFRLLGASWVRVSFWDWGKVTVADGKVAVDFGEYPAVIEAFAKAGIHILATIQMIPSVLSSKPDETTAAGDAGPLSGRVKPADYAVWDQFVGKLATRFGAQVDVWEVGNEPNTPGHYWAGTPDEFVEFARHTAVALKMGDPDARIAMAGFTLARSAYTFLRTMLDQGLGEHMDILTVHSMYKNAVSPQQLEELAKKAGHEFPIWSTEPKQVVGVRNFELGSQVNTHFLHMLPAHGELDKFQALVHRDLSPTPYGILFSVAAKIIADGKFVPSGIEMENAELGIFQKGGERVAVLRHTRLGTEGGFVRFNVAPLAGGAVEVLDSFGRVTRTLHEPGTLELPIQGVQFVRGASKLEVVEHRAPQERPDPEQTVFEFVEAEALAGWDVKEGSPWKSGKYLAAYLKEAPGVVRLGFSVPETGKYQVLLSASSLQRLEGTRTLSPFAWKIDGGEKVEVTERRPSLWRESGDTQVKNTPLEAKDFRDTDGTAIYQKLVETTLEKGEHTFELRLTGPRMAPDDFHALYLYALVLRPVE